MALGSVGTTGRKHRGFAGVIAVAATVVAGCGTISPQASPPHTAEPPRPAATSPAPSGTFPPVGSPATAQPTAAGNSTGGLPASVASPVCAARDLHIANSSFFNGAGGYSSGAMTLINEGTRTCVLDGYPGVELLDSHGTLITNAARHCAYIQCPTGLSRVVLAPGHSAHFAYVWQDNPPEPRQRTCPESATALVTPPNAYDHRAVPLHIAPCGLPPVFGVGTVQAGPAPTG